MQTLLKRTLKYTLTFRMRIFTAEKSDLFIDANYITDLMIHTITGIIGSNEAHEFYTNYLMGFSNIRSVIM